MGHAGGRAQSTQSTQSTQRTTGLVGVSALGLVAAGLALVTTGPAGAAEPPPDPVVSQVATGELGTWFGDLEVRDGVVHVFRDNQEIAAYPADASSPTEATGVQQVPEAWQSDGFWQSDRDAFVVAPDGAYYVRAPFYNRGAGGGTAPAYGWGVGRLAADGTITPPAVPPGGQPNSGQLGGSSEGIELDPAGDAVYLGSTRYRTSGMSYGAVARLPLPPPGDQLAAAEVVVSADGYDTDRSETYHPGPFEAGNGIDARTDPQLGNAIRGLEVKSGQLYLRNGWQYIERVDLRTHTIETVVGGPYEGWDTPRPTEGMDARVPFTEIGAGPVVDRAGNLFFAEVRGNRHASQAGTVWQVRASDGTLHRVAGGGDDPTADPGDDPTSLRLDPVDLALDPDGNLYVSSNGSYGYDRQIVRLAGVAAADTAPGAPVDLAVVTQDSALTVRWREPADDGGQAVTSYTVRLHPQGADGTEEDVVRTVEHAPVTVGGLTNGTTYDVSVVATNGRGDGPAAVTGAAPAEWEAALTATPGGSTSVQNLDASGSRAPAGATYRFWCGDSDDPLGPASTSPQATCTYPRGSAPEGWPATVQMTDPATGRTFLASTRVVTDDPPDTVEGSRAFDVAHPDVEVEVAPDGSLDSDSCGTGNSGATCVEVDGARIVLAAGPGTFAAGSRVQVYRGDTATLQAELGDGVQVQGGFAVTWTPKVNLPQPLMVTIPSTALAGVAKAGRTGKTGRAGEANLVDLGGFFRSIADGLVENGRRAASSIGSAISAAATSVSSWFAAAAQSLSRPNGSATNDLVQCWGSPLRPSSTGLSQVCDGQLVIARGVPTERISVLDAGSGVVSAGGMNVVAAGGGNVVSAGGANLSPIAAGASLTLAGNSVVAAGGMNVISAGGANVVSAGGANVVSAGGANVISAGGGNLQLMLGRDPAFTVVAPSDPTPPTVSAVLDPPVPADGVYPHGTEVRVRLTGNAAGEKTVQSLHYEVTGAQATTYTLAAGATTELVVSGTGTSTVDFGALDDNLAESEPGSVTVEIAPPAPPSPPTGVTAVAGADHRSAEVSWTAPAEPGDRPLTGYVVGLTDLGRTSDGGGATAPRTVEVAAGTTSTTLTDLLPAHRYEVVVTARSEAGDSLPSPATELVTGEEPPPDTAPGAPSGLTATTGDGVVRLSWTAPTDTGGQPVLRYVVGRGTSTTGPFTTVGEPTTTSYEDGDVDNGTTYFYLVRAVNAVGTSDASAVVSATPARVLAQQSITFEQPDDRTYGDPDGALAAQATSGLPITFTSLTTGVCTVAGPRLSVVAAGTCRVEAAQGGDADHAAAVPVVRELAVAKARLIVTATGATMRRRGRAPAVAAAYAGFVRGDTVRTLQAPATCRADTARLTTSCAGVRAASYAPVYRAGRVKVARSGYALVSAPIAYWTARRPAAHRVVVDGGKVALSWKGTLPPGVRSVTNRKRSRLSFVGTPTTTGAWSVAVVAKKKVKKRGRTRWRTVARQTVSLRVS